MSVGSFLSSIVIVALAVHKVSSRCCDMTYPVALDNFGPRPCPLPIMGTVHTTPTIEHAPIHVPAMIPYPRTLANRCTCVKTVVKPQVFQQLINVPSVQRYVETSHRPVLEKIRYKAYPINSGVRDVYGNCAFYGDGEYSDCCCCNRNVCQQELCHRDICHIPVAAAMPVTTAVPVAASMPVTTTVPVAAALPISRAYRCSCPCACDPCCE